MKKSTLLFTLAAALLILAGGENASADNISFTLVPASGDISGLAGSTVGWGYTIINDTSDWLVTMSLSADAFQDGDPDSFFDFPALAPGTSATVDFVAGVSGVYQLTWDAAAPIGFVDSGTFILSSDYYNGDPLAGGVYIATAPDLTAAYSASVSIPTVVPEPSAVLLLSSGILLLWGFERAAVPRSRVS
jgi:hypothetical protein